MSSPKTFDFQQIAITAQHKKEAAKPSLLSHTEPARNENKPELYLEVVHESDCSDLFSERPEEQKSPNALTSASDSDKSEDDDMTF